MRIAFNPPPSASAAVPFPQAGPVGVDFGAILAKATAGDRKQSGPASNSLKHSPAKAVTGVAVKQTTKAPVSISPAGGMELKLVESRDRHLSPVLHNDTGQAGDNPLNGILAVPAEQVAEKVEFFAEGGEKRVPGAKAQVDFASVMPGLKSRPISETSFSGTCEVSQSQVSQSQVSQSQASQSQASQSQVSKSQPISVASASEGWRSLPFAGERAVSNLGVTSDAPVRGEPAPPSGPPLSNETAIRIGQPERSGALAAPEPSPVASGDPAKPALPQDVLTGSAQGMSQPNSGASTKKPGGDGSQRVSGARPNNVPIALAATGVASQDPAAAVSEAAVPAVVPVAPQRRETGQDLPAGVVAESNGGPTVPGFATTTATVTGNHWAPGVAAAGNAGLNRISSNGATSPAAQGNPAKRQDHATPPGGGKSSFPDPADGTVNAPRHSAQVNVAAQHSQNVPAAAAETTANTTIGASPQPHNGVPASSVQVASHSAASHGERQRVLDASGRDLPAAGSSGITSARLIQSMSEAEMRVGLHSSEFGSISIRTSLSQQRMVARITLDHGDLSQAIAGHVAATQTKLGSEYGLHAQIEVSGQGGTFSGDFQGSSQQEQRPSAQSRGGREAAAGAEIGNGLAMPVPSGTSHGYQLDVRA